MKEPVNDCMESADGRVQVLAPASWHASLRQADVLSRQELEHLPAASSSGYEGRGRPCLLRLDAQPPLVAKQLQHGGAWARWNRRWFLGSRRLRQVLGLLEHLVAEGVSTPPPAFGRIRHAPLLSAFCRLDLATVQVPSSRDLMAWLQHGASRPQRAQVASEAGALVARMHEAGVEHADLNLKNLLVQSADAALAVFVIDLEGSKRHPGPVPQRARVANLERLLRSFRKRGLLANPVSPTDLARFLRAYAPQDWKSLWSQVSAQHQRHAWRHRLSWWWQSRGTR